MSNGLFSHMVVNKIVRCQFAPHMISGLSILVGVDLDRWKICIFMTS
jgi:hypothetical protein